MIIVLIVMLGALAAAPLWWAWWLRRHPRPLRGPGSIWIGFAVTISACWLGVIAMYLALIEPETTPGGHPLAVTITFIVIALAVLAGITGSTISWNATRSARKRDAALGLATGRRWWPNWLAGLGCIFLAPMLVVIIGATLTVLAETVSSTSMTTDQVNTYMTPALVTAGIVMTAGLLYFFGIRDYLKEREARRLSMSNRTYLATEPVGDDQP